MTLPPNSAPTDFDPVNNTADGMYVQIRDKGAQVRALNTQLGVLMTQVNALTAQRDSLLQDLRNLRGSITQELTGLNVP